MSHGRVNKMINIQMHKRYEWAKLTSVAAYATYFSCEIIKVEKQSTATSLSCCYLFLALPLAFCAVVLSNGCLWPAKRAFLCSLKLTRASPRINYSIFDFKLNFEKIQRLSSNAVTQSFDRYCIAKQIINNNIFL